MNKNRAYTCRCCGEYHNELPTSYGTIAPVYYDSVPSIERHKRFELDDNLCIMDNEHFFIRGYIKVHIERVQEIAVELDDKS